MDAVLSEGAMQAFLKVAALVAGLAFADHAMAMGGMQESAPPSAQELQAVQTMLTARGGNGAALWRENGDRVAASIADGQAIPAEMQPEFLRSYGRTAMAPAALSEIDTAFARAFVGGMSADERANPDSITSERLAELTAAAQPVVAELLHEVHVAGLTDACRETRARAAMCMMMDMMGAPSNRWVRTRARR